jgi:hypothetical protein
MPVEPEFRGPEDVDFADHPHTVPQVFVPVFCSPSRTGRSASRPSEAEIAAWCV